MPLWTALGAKSRTSVAARSGRSSPPPPQPAATTAAATSARRAGGSRIRRWSIETGHGRVNGGDERGRVPGRDGARPRERRRRERVGSRPPRGVGHVDGGDEGGARRRRGGA